MDRFRVPLTALIVAIIVAFGATNLRRASRIQKLISESRVYLDSVQEFNKSTYHLERYAHYDYDQRRGTLVLSDSGGAPRIVANIQIIGDVSFRSHTWLWSWANPTIESKLADAARVVQHYGIQYKLPALRDSLWKGDELDGWNMTAIAAKLTHAKGAYRSPSDSGPLFMILTDIRMASPVDSIGHHCDSGCFAKPAKRPGVP